MNRRKIEQLIFGFIYFSLLIGFVYLSLQNGEQSANQSDNITSIVVSGAEAITGEKIEVTPDIKNTIRKALGHFGYFVAIGVFSWLFYFSFGKINKIWKNGIHFTTGFLFSLFTEYILQLITKGRTPNVGDVFLNYAGFVSISLIFTLVDIIYYYHKKKKTLLNP